MLRIANLCPDLILTRNLLSAKTLIILIYDNKENVLFSGIPETPARHNWIVLLISLELLSNEKAKTPQLLCLI